MFVMMHFSKDEYLYFIFYSLGLFCQHIYLKEVFVHICMFERDFFGEDAVGGNHSVSPF